jgi:lipoate-protein ligase A
MRLPSLPPAAAEGVIRWIPPSCLGGAWQMAIDEWLLDAAVSDAAPQPVLRLYRWSRPTLSLGRHQGDPPPRWLALARAGTIDLVRRPSGGGAVLHAGDLTYALVWPTPPTARRQAYRMACRWLQETFAELGMPLAFGAQCAGAGTVHCFASSTPADLLHEGGAKRVGSAQFWRRGRLLQHGSILIDPPRDLWRQLFGTDPPALDPLPVDREGLTAALRRGAARHFPQPGRVVDRPLRQEELELIAGRLDRYRPTGLEARATSPEATIERATWPSRNPSG